MVYVAFVIDAYSRRILGWRAASSMKTALVLDAMEQALRTRQRDGARDLAGLVHHTDAGSISASVGTVGDAYDNALAESVKRLVQYLSYSVKTSADFGLLVLSMRAESFHQHSMSRWGWRAGRRRRGCRSG